MSTTDPSRSRASARRLSTFHRAKLAFLGAGFVSLALSVALWAAERPEEAIFVGLWVPAIHSLGALLLTGEHDRG